MELRGANLILGRPELRNAVAQHPLPDVQFFAQHSRGTASCSVREQHGSRLQLLVYFAMRQS
jgi:hypothetical protein